jgi:hypothetical protein
VLEKFNQGAEKNLILLLGCPKFPAVNQTFPYNDVALTTYFIVGDLPDTP